MSALMGFLGFGTGVTLKIAANNLGKRRTLAKPWQHLMVGAMMGYIGYNMYGWEDSLMLKVNVEREKRGFLPIERIHLIPSFGLGPTEFEDKKSAPHN